MEQALELLQVVQMVAFVALAVAALVQWQRRRDRPGAWVAATFGALALAVVVARFLPERSEDPLIEIVRRLDVALIVLFPYFLYRFLAALIASVRWAWITAHVLTGLALVGALALDLPQPGEPRGALVQAYIYLLVVQWVFLLGRVATRLWTAGARQPAVVKMRMRTMSLGALGLAIAIVVAGSQTEAATETTTVDIAVQLFVLATAPFFLIGFAPPGILRTSWRQGEEARLRDVEIGLMEALGVIDVARVLLPHVTRLMGGRGALMADENGNVIDAVGFEPDEAERVAKVAVLGAEEGFSERERRQIVAVPIGSRWLAVRASAYTPYFGREETEMLDRMALLARLALARAELFEQQREQAEDLREQAKLLDLAQDAIFVRDIDGTIKYWNRGAQRLYGYTARRARGKTATDLLRTQLPEPFEKIMTSLRERGVWEGELVQSGRDGRQIVVSSRWAMQQRRDGSAEILEINTDISERKRQEAFREHFIANAAHELRTPLTSMLGFVDLLTSGREVSESEMKTALGAISRSGVRLSALVKDLLDLSRLQLGQVHIELKPVEVGVLARETLAGTPPPPDKSVQLDVPENIRALADPERLDQVLANLLLNAYKHGGSEISVQATTNGNQVLISVVDSGPGVEESFVQELFEPFTRGANAAAGGSGLGLAITKMLVEACGGQISYLPQRPQGAKFQIALQKAA